MTARLWEIIRGERDGVLAVVGAGGVPHLSNVYYLVDPSSDTIRMSTTTVRAKGRHLPARSTGGVVRRGRGLLEVRGCGRPGVARHRGAAGRRGDRRIVRGSPRARRRERSRGVRRRDDRQPPNGRATSRRTRLRVDHRPSATCRERGEASVTTTTDQRPTLHVPARDIPVPTSVSPEAQRVLALGIIGPPDTEWPAQDDADGWKALVAGREAFVMEMVGDRGATPTADVEERDLGDFPVYVITPEGVPASDRRVYLEIHGGAWIQDGGPICRSRAVGTAETMGARVWAVDYRMPPDHPFPTPVDDCLAAYRALARRTAPGGHHRGRRFRRRQHRRRRRSCGRATKGCRCPPRSCSTPARST